jgi:membrane protein YqaA with SNARE-associated domain
VLELLGLLLVSIASALVPLINIELYLVGLSTVSSTEGIWLFALLAGLGQMLGKIVWYFLGSNSLRWGWIRRKVEKPKAKAKLELWQRRTHDRPAIGAVLLFASSLGGVPPLAVTAVLAGQLRMQLAVFAVVILIGRTLRFAAVLGGADWIAGLLGL